MPRPAVSRIFLLFTALLLAFQAGCGKLKGRDDRRLVIHEQVTAESQESRRLPDDLRELQDFIQLYFDNGGVARGGLTNLFGRYKDQLGKFLDGTGYTPEELLDLLFKFDANGDGTLKVGELVDGIQARIPVLKWIPVDGAVSSEDLFNAITLQYPKASPAARTGLQRALLRFDEQWAGGNGNHAIERTEVKIAGLILAAVGAVDFDKDIQLPTNASIDEQIMLEVLKSKVNQQLIARYPVTRFEALPKDDAALEWMQLALRYYLAEVLATKFGVESDFSSDIPKDKIVAALSVYGAPLGMTHSASWERLRKFYDHPISAGNGDGLFRGLEIFALATDLEYAHAIGVTTGYSLSKDAIAAHRGILASLIATHPRVGNTLFTEIGAPRADFWDKLTLFDDQVFGGNHDRKLDDGEITMALAHARLVELLYRKYDNNNDLRLSRKELMPLAESLLDPVIRGEDPAKKRQAVKFVLTAFFAGAFDAADPKAWTKFKGLISVIAPVDYLEPHGMFERISKAMPFVTGDKALPL